MSTLMDRAAWVLDDIIKSNDKSMNGSANGYHGTDGESVEKLVPGMDPRSSDLFIEEPVPLNVFVNDKMYLNQPLLSDEQFKSVALGEAVYFPETFELLDWPYKTEDWWNPGYTELTFMWGKGSGKDFISRIISARVAYLLACLKDPQTYYNMGPDEAIDILNVARSSKQASKVFFMPLSRMINRSPWFSDKADIQTGFILFRGQIQAHSGHADQESQEGLNLILGVADEIASFKTKEEQRSRSSPRPGMHSADAVADMMRSSGQSRFPGVAKVVYISYPRFQGDFITQKYEASRLEPTAYGSKKATWEVNPTKSRAMLDEEFRKDPEGSAAKYECKPPKATNKYFRNDRMIDIVFQERKREPVDDLGFLYPDTYFDHGKICAAHIDIALTRDRGGLAIAHLQDWSVRTTQDGIELRQPIVFVDLVTSFHVSELGVSELDLTMFEDFIIECRRRGARFGKVTADQFQSAGTLQNLKRQGIETDRLSVDRDTSAYDILKGTIYSGRLVAYYRERIVEELKGLKIINGIKVDHEPSGSKDEADALAGAVTNVVALAVEHEENQAHGDHIGIFEPQSEWFEQANTTNPWSKRATYLEGFAQR